MSDEGEQDIVMSCESSAYDEDKTYGEYSSIVEGASVGSVWQC